MSDSPIAGPRRRLAVVGVNHESAPIDVREKLAVGPDSVAAFRDVLHGQLPDAECIIVSTCNRVELYVATTEDYTAADALEALCRFRDVAVDAVRPHTYTHEHRDCMRHLFRVATSLDSMVVGEAEVLGQVKQAYAAAAEAGCTGKILNGLFQRAFTVAKQVRTETDIGRGRVSVASVAVDFTERIFSSLVDKTILVIGAGEAAEGVLKALVSHGATAVLVANRTYEHAVDLSEAYQGSAIRFEHLQDHLPQADIIIGSSAAPHPVIKPDAVRVARRQRRALPMLFLDLSSPRDIDPAVGQLDNVYLYDLDDLKDVAEQHLDLRAHEVAAATALVDAAVDAFAAEFDAPDLGPSIAAVRDSWLAVRDQELQRMLGRLNGVSDEDRREIEYFADRLVNKLLHQPVHEVKSAAKEEEGHHVVRAFLRLLHHRGVRGDGD